jgi:hypothetical protein
MKRLYGERWADANGEGEGLVGSRRISQGRTTDFAQGSEKSSESGF